jgi:hypothetical protein
MNDGNLLLLLLVHSQSLHQVPRRQRASNDDNDDDDNDALNQSQAESSTPHDDEHTIADPSISIDSQIVEVSIMEESPLQKANDDKPAVKEERDNEDSNYEEESVPGLANKALITHNDDSISDNLSMENKNTTNDTQKVL